METKPFSLQSPEQIAKDYGGNKQKIAEAMQMGIVDPTAGTLAGMFIDRMRNAAQAEATPQQTVAQQVFTPPQMPAGLGATPQAAMSPLAPSGQMPPAPPQGELGPAPQVPGMAMGGVASLPIPDDMFVESDDAYASGGLVAFAAGTPETGVQAPQDSLYGLPTDLQGIMQTLGGYMPQRTEEELAYQQEIASRLAPEEQAKDRKAAFWQGMGKLAERLGASRSPTFLGGLAESLGGGASDLAAALDEQKKETQDLRREAANIAELSRKEKIDLMKMGIDVRGDQARLKEQIKTREIDTRLKERELGLAQRKLNAYIAASKEKPINIQAVLLGMVAKGGAEKEVALEFMNAYRGRKDSTGGDDEESIRAAIQQGRQGEGSDSVIDW